MFRSSFPALLCLAAAPAFAQNQTAPAAGPGGLPPEIVSAAQQAGAAFMQCVQTGTAAVPATVTPEAGATGVLAGCSTQRQAVDRAAEAVLAALPAEQRPMVQEMIRAQIAGLETQIAAGIRQSRAPQAPAATGTPAPAQ